MSTTAMEESYAEGIHFVSVGDVRTRYYASGSGDPLLLIHGGHYGFSDSFDMWSYQLSPLSSHFKVWAPDRLGQGATDNPSADSDYTFDASYDHLVCWMQTMGIGHAHVVGHSRGALYAAKLALEHPELVRTACLVDTRTLAPRDPMYPQNQKYTAAVRAAQAGLATRETVPVEPVENSFSSAHVTPHFVDRLLELHQLQKSIEAQRKIEVLDEEVFLPSIERNHQMVMARIDAEGLPVPTLVIWGRNDPTAQYELGLQLFARICARTPRASLYVLNEAGHYSFREKPTEFNATLSAFCASN